MNKNAEGNSKKIKENKEESTKSEETSFKATSPNSTHTQTQIGNNYYINNNFYGMNNNPLPETIPDKKKLEQKQQEICKNCEKSKHVIII